MRIMLLVIFCLRIAIFKLVTRYLHNIQQVCLKNIHLFGLQTFQQTFKRNLKQFHQTVWLLALSNWLSQLLKIGRLGYESIFVESVPFNSDLNRFYQLSKHSIHRVVQPSRKWRVRSNQVLKISKILVLIMCIRRYKLLANAMRPIGIW